MHFIRVFACAALLGTASISSAGSAEPGGFGDFLDILIDSISFPPAIEIICNSITGTQELIELSGGKIEGPDAEATVASFNNISPYHCSAVQIKEKKPELKFWGSFKDERGEMWNVYSTSAFGPVSYTWRKATIPYS